jgi:hypothetical protein
LQSGRPGRGGVEVLGRPQVWWPGRARVLAFGCCAGPPGRVVAGNILSEVTALSGRAEPRWVLAGCRQVPSESVARRSRHVRRVEWRVGPMCRADCGQWWPAKLCVQLGRPKSVSAPAHCGPRCPARWARAIARAVGCPAGPARVSGRVRGESAGDGGPRARGVAGAYVRVLGRPAAGRQYPGDWAFQSSPQSAAKPPRIAPGGCLLIPKATEGLFKLEAGFALTAHSAGCGDAVVGPPCV